MNVYIYKDSIIPEDGLLGYRPLQSDLLDASGNGNDGSWYSGTGSFGTIGDKTGASVVRSSGAYRLSAQHIVTPITENGENISVLGWIYFNSKTTNGPRNGLFGNGSSSSSSQFCCGLRANNSYDIYIIRNGVVYGGPSPSVGTRYFWCVTASGTTLKFYIDGVLKTTTTCGTSLDGLVYRFGVGTYDQGGWGGTDGYVRHCAIYNRALTDAEVLQFYNNTK